MGQTEYPEEYYEKVFYLWYKGGRKEGNAFINSLPPSHDGRKPSKFTVIDWKNTKGWVERADALDAEVSRAIDQDIVNERREMFKEQVVVANELVKLGRIYLNDEKNGIKTDASAIRAIDLGLSTQRISTGMAEAYFKISKMTDNQLDNELKKLLGGKSDNENIDGEIINEEE